MGAELRRSSRPHRASGGGNEVKKRFVSYLILVLFLLVSICVPKAWAADPVGKALDQYAASGFKDRSAIDTIFRHLDITTKADEGKFLEKIHAAAKAHKLKPGVFEARVRGLLDEKRFATVDGLLKKVYRSYGKDLDVVVRTGSSGIRYLEMAEKRSNHEGYRLLFSDDDISFVGKKAVQAAKYFNELLEKEGLERLKVKGFDIVHLKNIRGIDLHLLNLLEEEKFVGETSMSGIKKEMLVKGAVIAENKGGQLAPHAETLSSYIKTRIDSALADELDAKMIREAVKKYGSLTMVGSCERQITKAHGGWNNLSDAEKVKYVLRERLALKESGALETIGGMDAKGIEAQIKRLKALKAKGKLTKGELRWLKRVRAKNISLAFEEIPYKLNPILSKARVSGRSLAGNPEARKALDELTVGFVLLRDHVLEVPEKEILAKLRKMAGKNNDLYKMLYTSFQQGKELSAALDAWLKAGLSREAFVEMLLKAEGHLARLELIKARRAAAKKGSAEAKTLAQIEKSAEREGGDRFLVKLLKSPTGKKLFIGVLVASGGAYIYKKMYNSWMAGKLGDDLSDAAFALIDWIPGGMSFKQAVTEGVSAKTVFSFVKEALYFTPAWPLVLAGDVAVMSIDIHGALRVSNNQNGLIDLLVYAGKYTEDNRFVRLELPRAVVNERRGIPKSKLKDFFFTTKTVVVPVSGQKRTYRISNLAKVSNEILDQVFLENDAATKQLRMAAQQQLTAISHSVSWARLEKGSSFSGVFEYAKWLTGFSTICEKSPEKWCRVFKLLKTKIVERRKFVKEQIMIPYLVQQAEMKHAVWVAGSKPPVEKLEALQQKLEALRGEALEISLAKEVGKRADKVTAKAKKNRETREKQLLEKGKYWQAALKTYTEIYTQNRKMVESITRKLGYPDKKLRKRILRFPWTGDYKQDLKSAEAARKGFYHGSWKVWTDVQKIKGGTPAPATEIIDRQALSILANVQFIWRMAMDRSGHPEKGVATSSKFAKDYKVALQKVTALYKKTSAFQALVEKGARIVYNPLHLGKQTVFALKITGKKLKEMQDKRRLEVTWRSPHGDFGSGGKSVKVNFITYHLLPVTVEVIVQNRFDATQKGVLTVVVPVAVPRGLFHLTLKPGRPKPREFVRADVGMPDRYLNSYQFHYTWRGKNCRVEDDDRSHVVVTAPKTGEATVTVAVSATDKHGKRIALGSDAVNFTVSPVKEKPNKKKKTAKKGAGGNTPSGGAAGNKPGESGGGTEPGGAAGAETVAVGKSPAKQPKKVVKHGAGGSASGMYPAETFNGQQISYSVSGASMPKMKDVDGFTTSRHYEGRLGDGVLSVSGTARVTWSPDIVLSVSVSAGSKHAKRTYKFKGPGSRSFSLKIPIPKDATDGGFSISMGGSYGNGEFRSLVVSGNFTENGPEGKAPKGTEDLSVKLTGPKDPVQAEKKVEITAAVRGGRFPYKYTWSGAKGTGEKSAFQSGVSGPHTVTLKVTDADGNTASGSVKVVVESPEFEVVGLPARPVYGSTARLRVRVKKGGKGSYKPIWQASEPGIEFDPPEGMSTTVTFGRVKKIAIWIQVPQPAGQKTIESKQVHAQVVGPKFTLALNPTKPYVGQEIRARISSSAKIPDDAIRWVWTSPPSSNRMEYNDPASEIGFKLKDDKPLALQAEARVPHYGDVIGTVQKSIQAKRYDVKVTVLGPLGPKPMVWKEGKGLVEVKKAIAVHQNVRLLTKIIPTPKVSPIYYHWTLNEDSHFAGLSMGKEVTVNRSQTGTCIAMVVVKDKDGTILGKGKGTFSVTISQTRIDEGKKKAKDQKKVQKLLQQGRKLWNQGKLQQAITQLASANRLVPKDKEISEALRSMQKKKKEIDDKLRQAATMIKQEKLKAAEDTLSSAGKISSSYPKYKEVQKQLTDAKKKAAEKKKQEMLAKQLQEKAKALWDQGNLDKAVGTMKKAAQTVPKNTAIADALKKMQGKKRKMDDALAKADNLTTRGNLGPAESALKVAERISKNYPPYTEALKKLNQAKKVATLQDRAKKLWEQKKYREAIDTLKKAAALAPKNQDIRQTLTAWKKVQTRAGDLKREGRLLETADELQKAVEKYKESLKVWPDEKLAQHVSDLEKTIKQQEEKTKIEAAAQGKKKKPLDVSSILGEGKNKPTGSTLQNNRNREKAKGLKREGALLEAADELEKAVEKYKESLNLWPDEKLEQHVAALEKALHGQKTAAGTKKPLDVSSILGEGKNKSAGTPKQSPPVKTGKKPLSIDKILGENPAAKPSVVSSGATTTHTTRPPPSALQNVKIIAAAGVSGNTRKRISLSLDPGMTKIIQILITEASELTHKGRQDYARIGEASFYTRGGKIQPSFVVADSNAGHGFSAKQCIDGDIEYRYRDLGAKGWASAPMRRGDKTWLMFHFSRPVNITRVVVITAPTRPYRLYSFQVRKYSDNTTPTSTAGQKSTLNQAGKQRNILIREGYAAENAGHLKTAIQKYTDAQKIRRDAKVAAHIRELKAKIRKFDNLIRQGYGYEKKGNLASAIATYKKALAIRHDAKVAVHVRALEKRIAGGTPPNGARNTVQGTSTLKHGIWVLTRVKGEVGIPVNKKSSYWRGLVSGREGRIVMVNTIRKSGYVAFKSVSTWQRPPNRLVSGSKVAFTLTIHKLADPRKYSENHGLSMDTHDLGCGATYGGGKIGSVGVYSVHSPKNPTVRKTFPWKVPEGRKGKILTLRVCYSGVSFKGDHGWRYYYTWVPSGSPIPRGIRGGTKSEPPSKGTTSTTNTSSKYTRNSKGDVFKGGHWAGSRGQSDWLQRNFSRVIPISKIYIGRASTDITTKGFRLVLKLRRPNGTWVVVDELRNTNINRTVLSGGAKGRSISSYTKRISPPIKATAFRLEFYGHGWFDASDIRFYTPRKKSGKIEKTSNQRKIVVTADRNVFPNPAVGDDQADANNFVIDGNQSRGWVRLLFRNSMLNAIRGKSVILKLTISTVKSAASANGIVIYHNGVVVGRVGKVAHGQIVKIALDLGKTRITNGKLDLVLKAAGDDAAYIKSKASGQGAELIIVSKFPWTGTYRYSLNDRQGSMVMIIQLTQNGSRLTGVAKAKAVSSSDKDLNFEFKKTVTGVCSGNRGKIKMEGQPYDKVVLIDNGRKLVVYDAEDNKKKYVLRRVR